MANLSFCNFPDVESILATTIKNFFYSKMKFTELFPQNTLKVSTDHPFLALMDQQVPEGGSYNLESMPSITVIDTNFNKLIETAALPKKVIIKKEILDEIAFGGGDQFTMSKQDKAALTEAFKTTNILHADGFETSRKTQIAIEVWADNNIMKSRLFDMVSLCLIEQSRTDVRTNYGLMIEEETISGERSGIYNFDFGKILYGGIIRFTVGYFVGLYTVTEGDTILGGDVVIQNNSIL